MKKKLVLFWAMIFFTGLEAHFGGCCPSGGFCTEIFSALPQLIFPGEAVRLEKVSIQSCEIDLSFASVSGMILFNRSGTYKIVWYGQARSCFNISWILGVSLDDVVILGNVYGNSGRHSRPERFEGSLVLSINAGQVLRFVNASSHPIELIPKGGDSQRPTSSFTLCLSLFKPTYPNPF